MKYVIASDIHGSAYWCERLLQTVESEGADGLILLGDLLYHGPRNELPDGYNTKKTFTMLNAIKDKITAVRGNCDSEVDQMVLAFPMLADYALLPTKAGTLFLTHGHLFSAENPPLLKRGDVLLNGHFHVPTFSKLENGGFYVNCGSVALPKDGYPHSCIVFEDGTFTWLDLETGGMFDSFTL